VKNIVFIINVEKPGQSKPEYQYSINSWKHWCEKVGAELFVLDQPLVDMDEMHIIWQRYFLFDLLDHNEIKYDQILLVDADTIVHPECPDFFKETDHEYCLVHDDGSYDWILRGMEHYEKRIFTGEWFPFWEYGNSGFQIVNIKHRPFFDSMREFYSQHKDTIQFIQSSYGIGTDQTPLNFMLRKHDIGLKLLPYKYNMTCMPKKEILGDDHLYTKLGWVYHFNGLPNKNESVPHFMEKAYKYLYK
jgi:lipopolysaccharide biosynthesis glycosyltransferase|tara:strand:+ start:2653 stop:3390 length:738 start_codon:yes stop_codon:yes gene_type:complete